MLIKRKRGWEMPEREATPEALFLNRRNLLKGAVAGGLVAAGGLGALGLGAFGGGKAMSAALAADTSDPSASLYPAKQNPAFTLDRPVTAEKLATGYNNFYEFGTDKDIVDASHALKIRPWTVKIDGLVEQEQTLAIDDLFRQVQFEERLYRHRCVEAWSMAVPWTGFPLKALVDLAKPTSGAKYLRMETFKDSSVAPGQRQFWYPWPYVEGLTMAEATNELAFLVTGIYGKPLPTQNGAPLRLAIPWKYGFKSVKSIVRFSFTAEPPKTMWQSLQPEEYGFWANVNPDVPHPRWSQATERFLGQPGRRPTLLFNGYAEQVADLYKGLEGEKLYM
ncbi:protein-methionine-sulfoxide reductase catalytic subunit MsrP [Aliidongia dinghuensis]|nr:protein-methionine-sulfoxide reductase catalytic subunit MsrP [Aliidongia dinghuensis]